MKQQEGKQAQQTNASFEYFLCLFCILRTSFTKLRLVSNLLRVILNSETSCLYLLGLEAWGTMSDPSFSFSS